MTPTPLGSAAPGARPGPTPLGAARAWVRAQRAGTTGVLAASRFPTWRPTRRTHLLCLVCALVLTLVSLAQMSGLPPASVVVSLAGGACVALISVWPLGAAALALLLGPVFHMVVETPIYIAPGLVPWLCACVLVSRGFRRVGAYTTVVIGVVEELVAFLWFLEKEPNTFYPELYAFDVSTFVSDYYFASLVLGTTCLVVTELLRAPRAQTEASARRFEADLERQRLLVVSELHDTVVRDLTHAVMRAEQARLGAAPGDSLAGELAAMTASVRVAVEQLRSSLRAMGRVAGGEGFDVLASVAPRPLAEVVAQARTLLAARGVALEVMGLEALERPEVTPGVRQQLVRVLSELVVNMSKYAAPGAARLLVECDGVSLEAMASNVVVADGEGAGTLTSGLGLSGPDAGWRPWAG
ncbi:MULTISPECIES: ATP-binding protein [unclassified Actinomyces]|uniref:ATP-binding protein n=1 Tax=unclassified Actinomyces TaxID=2609248 RepID=UPI002017D895|nr:MULTISPECIES: ATP-binding protein [unclassified Actinomyces]